MSEYEYEKVNGFKNLGTITNDVNFITKEIKPQLQNVSKCIYAQNTSELTSENTSRWAKVNTIIIKLVPGGATERRKHV